ncbi:hypothetical protein [Salinimicrobium catena]|uniref:hypothetical protein n=1 Tax=Salinimicrobium catena TaxID=390640 RepID=UPI00115FE490|nr:hypothetical protein [Salinimicrobium catena]
MEVRGWKFKILKFLVQGFGVKKQKTEIREQNFAGICAEIEIQNSKFQIPNSKFHLQASASSLQLPASSFQPPASNLQLPASSFQTENGRFPLFCRVLLNSSFIRS